MSERLSKEQQFLMLVQTAAIVKELSGETAEVLKIRTDNLSAHVILGVAMEAFQYVPNGLDVLEAAEQFIEYTYSKEQFRSKPSWLLQSGF